MGAPSSIQRIRFLGLLLLLVVVVCVVRLFQLQVLRHDYYQTQADAEHLRKYEIAAERGEIFVLDRGEPSPVAVNQKLITLYADPLHVDDTYETARKLAELTHDDPGQFAELLSLPNRRYVVLKKRLSAELGQQINQLELGGIGIKEEPYRYYPEGSLLAQVLGFVNDEGHGQYGIEEYFDERMRGRPGLLNAKTDTRGIPIASQDNIERLPTHGADIVLTIDRNLQAQVEAALQAGFEKYQPSRASAVVLDPKTGAVRAMASLPNFDPNKFGEVKDPSAFNNVALSLYEPGSIFKIFTMAAGLNEEVVQPETQFLDHNIEVIDGWTIQNAGTGVYDVTRTMTEVITKSINTGVVYVLRQLGSGEINDAAKSKLYDYFYNRFFFGHTTGIELPGDEAGSINDVTSSSINYANMTFGQGITASLLQVAAAYIPVANGGTYYKPYIVERVEHADGAIINAQPEIGATDVVSPEVARELRDMMETVVTSGGGYGTRISGYRVGGKTGTAQIPNPDGGYFNNRDIGSFAGMAPLDDPAFVMVVRFDEPRVYTYAGSEAAGPVFGDIAEWLLDYYGVPPSGN